MYYKIFANLNKPEDPCGSILICPHYLISHMEVVSCHNSLLIGYTEITLPVLLLANDLQVLVVLLRPRFLWALTRVLNLDNVGMGGELHDMMKELFKVFLLILR